MRDRSQSKIFEACEKEGSFLPLAKADTAVIASMLSIAKEDLATLNHWRKAAPKESGQWNAIFKIGYDVLHTLAECVLQFDRIKAKSHECVFSYLCERHPELELSWEFFEKVRSKRNRSIYYGKLVSYDDWKEIDIQLLLYIGTLQKFIDARLKK